MDMRKYMMIGLIAACAPVYCTPFEMGMGVAMGVMFTSGYALCEYNPYRILYSLHGDNGLHVVENNARILPRGEMRKINWKQGNGKRAIDTFIKSWPFVARNGQVLNLSKNSKRQLMTQYLQGKTTSLSRDLIDTRNSEQSK